MFGGRNMGGGGGGSLLRSAGRAVTRANFTGGPHQEPLSSSSTNSGTTSTSTTTNSPRHAQKAKSSSSSNNNLSLSSPSSSSPSSPFASFNAPVSTIYGLPASSSWPHSDEFDWVSVDAEGYADHGFVDDLVLGPAPSEDEVHSAISALQQ
ncbi:hypothetical protein PanWU01x14_218970 [Parasponia andersonii]|uniref:Uncharacterized protein n=1 Tax=Parasponia andersonii TaxID=3476 RepID=A0A2P5BQG0_PARAD|nr:hypothetical protein PanWU01x14_218970 [Parasponia andersonii]